MTQIMTHCKYLGLVSGWPYDFEPYAEYPEVRRFLGRWSGSSDRSVVRILMTSNDCAGNQRNHQWSPTCSHMACSRYILTLKCWHCANIHFIKKCVFKTQLHRFNV